MSRIPIPVPALLFTFLVYGLCIRDCQSNSVGRASVSCDTLTSSKDVKPDKTCLCPGKPNMKRKDGTSCKKSAVREDNEKSARPGTCKDGVCVLRNFTKGCDESKAPEVKPGSQPPFGCVYYCDTTKGLFGFFKPGTVCEHKVNRTHYVKGVCKKTGEKVVCSEDVDGPPAC
uniref:Putative secreted protein n=1 Tax=Amblyomma triste TaxID=251400 RepID=A0A023G6T7_AMBTT